MHFSFVLHLVYKNRGHVIVISYVYVLLAYGLNCEESCYTEQETKSSVTTAARIILCMYIV